MGNQGIILRKVTLDKTLNQLSVFLKGSLAILVLYVINGIFLEKSFVFKDVQLLVGLYVVVAVAFYYLKSRKKIPKNNRVMNELKQYFEVDKFEDVEKLDKSLVKEIKDERKFVAGHGQVVATKNYILFDLADGQFKLLPTKKIKRMYLSQEGRFVVNVETTVATEKFAFKNKKDAKDLIKAYNEKAV